MQIGIKMLNSKNPCVDGMFYPKTKEELNIFFDNFEKNMFTSKEKSRAVIAPHAGYVYSGKLAFNIINCLKKEIENIFIIAPAHKYYLEECAISNYDEFILPNGKIEVNKEIINELNQKFDIKFCDEAFNNEHAIEVQLPILNYLKKDNNFKIIPVLSGVYDIEKVKEIIGFYWQDEKNGFIISSDLSHFHKPDDTKKIDLDTANLIEDNKIDNFNPQRACGNVGICGLVKFANENNFSLIRLGLYNSSDITHDTNSAVGYGAWFLIEKEKNKYIKKYYSDFILDVCKNSIKHKGKYYLNDFDDIFNQMGACFVTLKINGFLRGCIGSIIAYESLIDNLVKNAYNSAFKDPRFMPLSDEEFNKIEIEVSLLSNPKKMNFINEEDLLNQIVPFEDGLIIKDKNYQAVYLPSVWEQLPDKKLFLNKKKKKAGLNENHFSNTFEAYRFYAEKIK